MSSAEQPISVDDLRRKAMRIKDMAESEVREVRESRGTQLVVAGVVVVFAAVSLAYYLGSRRSCG